MKTYLVCVIIVLLTSLVSAEDQIEPDSTKIYRNQAVEAIKKGDFDAADELLRAVIRLDSADVTAYQMLAKIAGDAGRHRDAAGYLAAAYKVKSDDPNLANQVGAQYSAAGDLTRAIEFYQKAVSAKPQNADYLLNLGNALSRAGKPAEALEVLQRANWLRPSDWQAPYFLGNCHAALSHYDSAQYYFTTAIERGGDEAQLYYFLAMVDRKLDDLPGTRQNLEKAIEREPRYLDALVALGDLYMFTLHYPEAADMYRRVLDIDSTDYRAWQSLGVAYAVQRDLARTDTVMYRLSQVDSSLAIELQGMIKSEVQRINQMLEEQRQQDQKQ
jgi:protein O-GlcNAc transferase